MYKKIAATLLVTSALMAPSFAAAEETATAKEMALEETFVSRGLCESTLKRIRNVARQTVKSTPAGSGQTNSAANRLANPAIKFVCTAVSGTGNGGSVFKIVEG